MPAVAQDLRREVRAVEVALEQTVAANQDLSDAAVGSNRAGFGNDSDLVVQQWPAGGDKRHGPRRVRGNWNCDMLGAKARAVSPEARQTIRPGEVGLGHGKDVFGHGIRGLQRPRSQSDGSESLLELAQAGGTHGLRAVDQGTD